MSTLGEVVFCVDCDQVRNAQLNGTDSVPTDAPAPPPRRMAIKRDANGDPLCAACLDARHVNRRAEFLMHEGRAPIPGFFEQVVRTGDDASAAKAEPEQKPKSGLIRIVRQRGSEPPPAPEPERPRASLRRAKREAPVIPAAAVALSPRTRDRDAELRFVTVAAEMGFLRAQKLLDQLKQSVAKVRRGGAR